MFVVSHSSYKHVCLVTVTVGCEDLWSVIYTLTLSIHSLKIILLKYHHIVHDFLKALGSHLFFIDYYRVLHIGRYLQVGWGVFPACLGCSEVGKCERFRSWHFNHHNPHYAHTKTPPQTIGLFGLRLIPCDSLNIWLCPGTKVNAPHKNVFIGHKGKTKKGSERGRLRIDAKWEKWKNTVKKRWRELFNLDINVV